VFDHVGIGRDQRETCGKLLRLSLDAQQVELAPGGGHAFVRPDEQHVRRADERQPVADRENIIVRFEPQNVQGGFHGAYCSTEQQKAARSSGRTAMKKLRAAEEQPKAAIDSSLLLAVL